MSTFKSKGAALLLPLALLVDCSKPSTPTDMRPPGKAAHNIYIVDVSASTATMNDEAVFHAVEARISDDMKRTAKLDDVFSVYESGSADASRMVGHPPIVTGYNLRISAASTKMLGQLQGIYRRYHAHGGDDATHLVQSLEAIGPDCSSGRDVVWLISDGKEEDSDVSSARALAKGKPVNLSPPSGRYLAGCRIVFLGFGLTADTHGKQQLLPPRQLAALRQGWLEYLKAAGVPTENVAFISAL